MSAAGESSSPIKYEFLDRDYKQGNNYYRLKMVDLDGTFEYSEVINIHVSNKNEINVLPNPTKDIFNIYFEEAISGEMNLRILDISGKVVVRESLMAEDLLSHDLNIESLATGVYFIQIHVDNLQFSSKIVKQ